MKHTINKIFQHIKNGTLINRFVLIPTIVKEKKYRKFINRNKQFIKKKVKGAKLNLYNDSLLSELIYNDRFEKTELKFLTRFLSKGDHFVDVGANIGLFSMIASKTVGQKGSIISFEPTPETFRRLNENIILNKYGNIKSFPFALAEFSGTTSFYTYPEGRDAWNTLSKPQEEKYEEIIIQTFALDDFIHDNVSLFNNVTLLKIDVEGWEIPAFKGGNKFFSSPQAPTLMVEFCDIQAQKANLSCTDLYNLLENYGYKMYKYDGKKNILFAQENKPRFVYENLIALKETSFNNRIPRNS